jgi:hypothetical protein
MWGIALLAGNTPTARVLVVLAYLVSPLVYYTFNFSPDVFGTLLVVGCYLAATRRRWVWCGLLAGLAVWAKVYLGVIVLPVAVLVVRGGGRAVLLAGVAAAIALVPMAAVNQHLFAGPLVTGYDREVRVAEDGALYLRDHYSAFNQPFLRGLSRLLFDRELGMVWKSPIWVLWPVGVLFLWRSGNRVMAVVFTAGIVLNLALFASYDMWHATIFGNRFLFPALALGIAAQGPLWSAVRDRLRRESTGKR